MLFSHRKSAHIRLYSSPWIVKPRRADQLFLLYLAVLRCACISSLSTAVRQCCFIVIGWGSRVKNSQSGQNIRLLGFPLLHIVIVAGRKERECAWINEFTCSAMSSFLLSCLLIDATQCRCAYMLIPLESLLFFFPRMWRTVCYPLKWFPNQLGLLCSFNILSPYPVTPACVVVYNFQILSELL